MEQLMDKEVIDTPIWSVVLLNGQEGLFSIGGTSVASVRQVERDTEDELSHLEGHEEIKRETDNVEKQLPVAAVSNNDWKWVKVHGSDGWWQILMGGIWVDGVKMLHNQPVILDVSVHLRAFYSILTYAGQHTFHPSPTNGCSFLLLFNLWKQTTTTSIRPVPLLPLPESTRNTFRIRWLECAST
jgi:hypothetical protein